MATESSLTSSGLPARTAPTSDAAAAQQIVRDALERYRRPDGYEGVLVEAAWQLEQLGRDAWPVLSTLACARIAECEFFVAAMVRIDGVPWSERRGALLAVAANPSANTRSRLFELSDELPHELRQEVLAAMAAPDPVDDGVADRAQAALGMPVAHQP